MDTGTIASMDVDTDVITVTCKIARLDTEVSIRENSKENMSAKVKACINTEARVNVSIDLRVSTNKETNIWMASKRCLRQGLTKSLAKMIRKDVNTEAKGNAVTLKAKTRRLDP